MTSAMDESEWTPPRELRHIRRDLKAAATTMSAEQARFYVDYYYSIQDFRIQAGNQKKAAVKAKEPVEMLTYTEDTQRELEESLKGALGAYARSQVPGRWALSICGIGPVLAAGLLAHVDIERSRTSGDLWSFAGLNPDAKWEKGEKRPWNAKLKVLCWKIGESFVKVQSLDSDVYGKVYARRKELEIERNLAGTFADQARVSLETVRFGADTDARIWYEGRLSAEEAKLVLSAVASERLGIAKKLAGEPGSGVAMLPPARIHLRSTRYAVKLFLSHFHHVSWENRFGEPPVKPYIFDRPDFPQHVHFVAPPNWPMTTGESGVEVEAA